MSAKEESRLADWVVQMARIGYGRTRQEPFDTIKKNLDDDDRVIIFKDKITGKEWYKGFVRRHREISEEAPMQL